AVPPLPHDPNIDPPHATMFSMALLEALQRIRVRYNRNIVVECAYVCRAHLVESGRCCRGDADHIARHGDGVAVDFRPEPRNAANVQSLWRETRAVADAFN